MIKCKNYQALTVDVIEVIEATLSELKPNLYKREVLECKHPKSGWRHPVWYSSNSVLKHDYTRCERYESGKLEVAFQEMIGKTTRIKG
jgi:hypothetical protein|tara:strand:+ start:118 stop:381 length:264 start_codon:yes stop_codon:yes gene_type:complete